MEQKKVLLAEDETTLAHIVRDSLEERGFEVILCGNGLDALRLYKDRRPHIIILDIAMPIMDGFEVAKSVRKKDLQIPIIFLTAKSQPKDVVAGFELGANDYLKKPFSMEELIVRIQVHLEKHGILQYRGSNMQQTFHFGDFIFNPHKHSLEYGLHKRQLTSRESAILDILCKHEQHVIEHHVILQEIWGSDSVFNARSLDVFISKLRKYLSKDPSVQILNVRGVGYKLVYG